MRNAKLSALVLGLAIAAGGCCCPSGDSKPGFFSRFHSCMCDSKRDKPVSYTGQVEMGPVIYDGPTVPVAPQGGSFPRIPGTQIPQVDEVPGRNVPYVPPGGNTSRPAKPMPEASVTKNPGT